MTLTAGIGFKTEHLDEALSATAGGLWLEVHAENYMVEGGPRLRALIALAERFAISCHGVGLSVVSVDRPDPDHLTRLKTLTNLIQPWAISDHLAWQKWNGTHLSDFLPFPRTAEALAITARNISIVQDAIKRPILIENPSLYADVGGHEMSEVEFLAELANLTGCGLLLDVNNVFVSARNLGFRPEAVIDSVPSALIGEVHLAGHSPDPGENSHLLIDSHDAPVTDSVWALYERLIRRVGSRPTLVERDDNLPSFATLLVERDRAHAILGAVEPAHA